MSLKKSILKKAGVKTEKEFYQKYPTKEAFLQAFTDFDLDSEVKKFQDGGLIPDSKNTTNLPKKTAPEYTLKPDSLKGVVNELGAIEFPFIHANNVISPTNYANEWTTKAETQATINPDKVVPATLQKAELPDSERPNVYRETGKDCLDSSGKPIDQCLSGVQTALDYNYPEYSYDTRKNVLGIVGDSWGIGDSVVSKGGEYIYNLQNTPSNGYNLKNNSSAYEYLKQNQQQLNPDFAEISANAKVGDVVEMWYKGSGSQGKAGKAGKANTHSGVISEKDGVKYVTHNIHGKWYSDKLEDLLTTETGGHKDHKIMVSGISRPNYEAAKLDEVDLGVKIADVPKVVRAGSGNRNPEEASEFKNTWQSGPANNRVAKEFVNGLAYYAPKVQEDFGFTDEEMPYIMKLAYGIVGKESGFGVGEGYKKKVKTLGLSRAYKNIFPDWIPEGDEQSEGLTQIKLNTSFNTPKEKELLAKYGIDKNTLYDPTVSSAATMMLVMRNYEDLKNITGISFDNTDPITVSNILAVAHNKGIENVIKNEFVNAEEKRFARFRKDENKYKSPPELNYDSIIGGLDTYKNLHLDGHSYSNLVFDYSNSLDVDYEQVKTAPERAREVPKTELTDPRTNKVILRENISKTKQGINSKVNDVAEEVSNVVNRGEGILKRGTERAVNETEDVLRRGVNKVEDASRDAARKARYSEEFVKSGLNKARRAISFQDGGFIYEPAPLPIDNVRTPLTTYPETDSSRYISPGNKANKSLNALKETVVSQIPGTYAGMNMQTDKMVALSLMMQNQPLSKNPTTVPLELLKIPANPAVDYLIDLTQNYFTKPLDKKLTAPKEYKDHINSDIPIMQNGGFIVDPRGQWAHPGKNTLIESNNITMEGVPYDVLGISDENDIQVMKANNKKKYKFKGKKVFEMPLLQQGGLLANMLQESSGDWDGIDRHGPLTDGQAAMTMPPGFDKFNIPQGKKTIKNLRPGEITQGMDLSSRSYKDINPMSTKKKEDTTRALPNPFIIEGERGANYFNTDNSVFEVGEFDKNQTYESFPDQKSAIEYAKKAARLYKSVDSKQLSNELGLPSYQDGGMLANALSGAASGAIGGASLGPFGIAGGAILGALPALLNKTPENSEVATPENPRTTNPFKMGKGGMLSNRPTEIVTESDGTGKLIPSAQKGIWQYKGDKHSDPSEGISSVSSDGKKFLAEDKEIAVGDYLLSAETAGKYKKILMSDKVDNVSRKSAELASKFAIQDNEAAKAEKNMIPGMAKYGGYMKRKMHDGGFGLGGRKYPSDVMDEVTDPTETDVSMFGNSDYGEVFKSGSGNQLSSDSAKVGITPGDWAQIGSLAIPAITNLLTKQDKPTPENAYDTEKIAQPQKFNFSNYLNQLTSGFNTGIQNLRDNTSGGAFAGNAQSLYAKNIAGINEINQSAYNTNAQLKTQIDSANAGIEGQNNQMRLTVENMNAQDAANVSGIRKAGIANITDMVDRVGKSLNQGRQDTLDLAFWNEFATNYGLDIDKILELRNKGYTDQELIKFFS